MKGQNELLELIGKTPKMEEIEKSIDIYSSTKDILNRINKSLGKTGEVTVINVASSNNYNIPYNGKYSTH